MENILSRHCIHPDVLLYEHCPETGELIKIHTRDDFVQSINRWKMFLVEKYNVQPGQTMMIDLWPGLQYYSLIFASMELGLVFIIDWPLCYNETDLINPKVTMYGQIDYVVTHSHQGDPSHPKGQHAWSEFTHQRNLKYGKTLIYEDMLFEHNIYGNKRFDEITNTIWATPESDIIYSSSSGTTGTPKKITYSHKEIYQSAWRLMNQYSTKNHSVLHYKSLQHGANLCLHFLPSFMVGGKLFTASGINGEAEGGLESVVKFAVDNKINHLFLVNGTQIMYFLENMPRADYTVNIITLYQITPAMLPLMKEKNINWIKSVFGDMLCGSGHFIKTVDQNTDPATYDVTNMGPPLDDFWQFEIRDDEVLWISNRELGIEWRTAMDKFKVVDGNYHFMGRADKYRIGEEWIELDDLEKQVKSLFETDGANISVDREMQKIYLAVWKPNAEAEIKLNKFLDDKYQNVKISYVLRNENYQEYFSGRKIDNSKIRQVCRERLAIK